MSLAPAASAVQYRPGVHVPVLDGLRGLAILLVICRHTAHYMGPETAADWAAYGVLSIGWVGVDLFFVLSGFLITGILLDARGGEHYFRNFYVRRGLRIFPLYYAFLVVLLVLLPRVVSYRAGGGLDTLLDNQLWYWSYLVNVLPVVQGPNETPLFTSHLWSLAVEEQFYLVWPAVVLWLRRERLFQLCVWMVVTAFALRVAVVGLADGDGHVAGYMLTPARMDALAMGALVAIGVRGTSAPAWLARWAWPTALGAGGVVLALVVSGRGRSWDDVVTQTVGYTAVAALAAAVLVLALLAPPAGRLHRTLARPALRVVGKYSYAMYLFHYPLIGIALAVAPLDEVPLLLGTKILGQVAFTVAMTLASLALAWLSWHLYERHFLKLKDRFPMGAAPAAPAAPARTTVWGEARG